ncbi:MAG: 3'-phosphoesterase [Nanoarchaeota archaeon]|nr:3'-phosphoesterase [Nanoarchaeota archaeon]
MTLEEYKKKRNFEKTNEPGGKKKNSEGKIYCIQKHNASHLHYDLRLEFEGVLKSWAIPKMPSKQKGTKRLAIETEDHPIEYANFEGVISEGNYGAGKVEIWDKGTYDLIEKDDKKIVVHIKGKKLTGEYVLLNSKLNGKKENWLFFRTK